MTAQLQRPLVMFQKPARDDGRKALIPRCGGQAEDAFENQMIPEPAASAQRHMSSGPDCPRRAMKTGADMVCEPAITAVEACKILGLKRAATVLKWAREGKIPSIREGDGPRPYVRFRASALDEWMRQKLHSSALPLASSPEVEE
jgi:excisionase family DNA binding protein